MNITVSLAQTDAESREGTALFQQIYESNFDLNFEAFHTHFPLSFPGKCLLLHNETNNLVATASLISPIDGLYPSEYYFETDIASFAGELPLHNAIEVGRLAKINDRVVPHLLVTHTIMLAVAAYLQRHKLSGWIATVKPAFYRIIKATGLVTTVFEKVKDCNTYAQREVIKNYKGDEVITFWAGTDDTIKAFESLPLEGCRIF